MWSKTCVFSILNGAQSHTDNTVFLNRYMYINRKNKFMIRANERKMMNLYNITFTLKKTFNTKLRLFEY